MRKNLVSKIRAGEELFPGVIGYEDTVIPRSKTPSSPGKISCC